jgi:transposase InsO family protein
MRVVEELLRGASRREVARVFGIAPTTITMWLARYRDRGVNGLMAERTGPQRRVSPSDAIRREAVTRLRQAEPSWGTRRVRDVLRRDEGLGVSETEVRRILHEEGLIAETRGRAPAREHGPRRFERATPNELWQTDIFTFLLRRHERLYLCAFMDDHSRFIVGWALLHHQKSELVMEAPLVWRMDRASCHRTERVAGYLESHGVLVLHGAPRHPQYYGQLERQNREHRGWLRALGDLEPAELAPACTRMLAALNTRWPRRALGWMTPAEVWAHRRPIVK